jgi:hypothetical protein
MKKGGRGRREDLLLAKTLDDLFGGGVAEDERELILALELGKHNLKNLIIQLIVLSLKSKGRKNLECLVEDVEVMVFRDVLGQRLLSDLLHRFVLLYNNTQKSDLK